MTADGRTLYFEEELGGGFNIVRTVRATVSAPFGPPALVAELEGTRSDGDPQTSLDGTRILFASDRAMAGNFDLYVATRVCP